jgi:IS5 family transposase
MPTTRATSLWCERWSENVVWQFFSGMAYYSAHAALRPDADGRFRRVLGEAGVEQLLKTTIEAAVTWPTRSRSAEFERVIVDTTVQEKAMAHPTDSRCWRWRDEKIARLAKRARASS